MNINEVSSRLERLERENCRMKRAGLAVVGLALAVALIGATVPEEIPEVIEAREFRVIDENGQARTELKANSFFYYDENGKLRAAMNGNGFFHNDENGNLRCG